MTRKHRLDLELVRRGLTASRSEARRIIEQGRVTVRGMPALRPSSLVTPEDPIALTGEGPRFVSRGGDKLDSALSRLHVEVTERIWLDAGASTGGFTDRLLQGGAKQVVAVDVGYGQFDWGLRNDPRVVLMERCNIRTLEPDALPVQPHGIVADLSFISLRSVLPSLKALAAEDADHLLLVKPQFEVGRDKVSKGVVRDPALWASAINDVLDAAAAIGLGFVGVAVAEPAGPSGNREFFVHLKPGAGGSRDAVEAEVRSVSI